MPVFDHAALASLGTERSRAEAPAERPILGAYDAQPVYSAPALRQLDPLAPGARQLAQSSAPVLVVEDDAATRDVLTQALCDEGIPVEAVANGRAALASLASHRPAMVVLDLGLPDMPGEGVAASLRRRYDDGVPIVVVSGAQPPAQLHANGYLSKPFALDDLLDTVGRVLTAV